MESQKSHPANTTLRKNAIVTLDIINVNAKGFGIGRVDDFVLFTEGALPGERIEAQIVKLKSRYGFAKISRIITPSPARITPRCTVAAGLRPSPSGICGGCQFQHCDYAAQLEIKKQIVIDALTRIGGFSSPPVADVLGHFDASDTTPWHYRNKGIFPVAPADNADGFAIGMYAARSHRLVEIDECLLQHPMHKRVLFVVRNHMHARKITPYDESSHTGTMRQIMVRTSAATDEVMVVLVATCDHLPAEDELAQTLVRDAGATTVLINPHTARGNTVLGNRFRTLTGSGSIEESIGAVRYRISPQSFFQVNSHQVKKLYDIALQMAGNADYIIDAHAGAGGITLYAAHQAATQGRKLHALGIDIVAAAINDAQKNADLNGINNVTFQVGAAEEVIPTMLSAANAMNCTNGHPNTVSSVPTISAARPQLVFLDPPRKGCETPLLDALITAHIPKVVYISCDPATLARDIKHLHSGGYTLQQVQPVDMFPHTGHVECVALLTKEESA
ncbi:MAG: 23S rRNA (uracil(1939)-C(5))-methyltransferase RlmD [Defluviitaleaceae bacterium]|nr:23S rRNA (uracil(1939)-C(5))-methyltransferase RlmD [Defluviitaleaceae bacterium]